MTGPVRPGDEPPPVVHPGGLPSTPPGSPLPPTGATGANPPPGTAGGPPVPERPTGEPERIKRTISSAVWIASIVGAILLILLIVFIAENSQTVKIDLIFGDTRTALAVGLLLSAVIGALLVAIPGSIRILQLRRQLKRHLRGRADT
jgi:uncharacterized integral membrane protein